MASKLLSAIGGLVGLAFGGPMGAALGSGIGTLASGGNIGDAFKSGIMGYGIASIPGVSGMMAKGAGMMGMEGMAGQYAAQQASQQALLSKMAPGIMNAAGGIGQAAGNAANAVGQGIQAGMGGNAVAQATAGQSGIFGNANMQNLILAGLIQAGEPKPDALTEEQKLQLQYGERDRSYQGTAAPDTRYAAMGGYIEGPGTGTSDSIPATIYQNGGPVQEARLSDGEFVMTADAVRGAGGGNRNAGAAKMYEMMNQFERTA